MALISARKQIPAAWNGNTEQGVLVCLDYAWIPYLVGMLRPLLREQTWKTETDWLTARQEFLYPFVGALMSGCDARILSDLAVLLAKSHGVNHSIALESALPGLAAALQNAETADTGGSLDDIYRHARMPAALGYAAGLAGDDAAYDASDTQAAKLTRLIDDGGFDTESDPADTLKAKLDEIRDRIGTGAVTLDDIKAYIDQLETLAEAINTSLGYETADPSDPGYTP